MTTQPTNPAPDIAEECERRVDGYLEVDYHGDAHDIVNITELAADLSRYAAHMRQQRAEIERLRGLEEVVKQLRVDEWERLERYCDNGSDWAWAVSRTIVELVKLLRGGNQEVTR